MKKLVDFKNAVASMTSVAHILKAAEKTILWQDPDLASPMLDQSVRVSNMLIETVKQLQILEIMINEHDCVEYGEISDQP